jgi:hypothetical protein
MVQLSPSEMQLEARLSSGWGNFRPSHVTKMGGIINNLEGTCYTSKISRGRTSPIIIIMVINSHAYGAWVGVLGKPTGSSGEHDSYRKNISKSKKRLKSQILRRRMTSARKS